MSIDTTAIAHRFPLVQRRFADACLARGFDRGVLEELRLDEEAS